MRLPLTMDLDSSVREFSDSNNGTKIFDFPDSDVADFHCNYSGSSPYHVNYCGFEPCQPGSSFGPFVRSSYLIHFVYSGQGFYQVGDKTFPIHSGQLFLIYPDVETSYWTDDDNPWTYGWVGFSGFRAEYILNHMGFSPENLVISVENISPIRECIDKIMKLHKITFSNELRRTSELLNIFSYIIENSAITSESQYEYPKSTYAQAAMQYMVNNYHKRLKVADIANYIGVDRSYLSKSFREEYHVSPKEYLIRLRVEQASVLLRTTDKTISVIASEVGYYDPLAFCKVFKQQTGYNPTEYRNMHAYSRA